MPLAPFLMEPAYRYGAQTPWGGNALQQLFDRRLPDIHTGESLEVSVIPGLESRNPQGRTLTQLIALYGAALTGPAFVKDFPLLLKLIDARQQLSVQVHPDDAYARAQEGKAGKAEAWVILQAQPGAELILGVLPGTTPGMLREASQQGVQVEGLLRRVPVQAGETYFIPAGTVHAIGAGIVLYEIQQSSDVTYRFYDWERRDAQGQKRTLHLEQALAVSDTARRIVPTVPISLPLQGGHGSRERLLDTEYFVTERYRNCRGAVIESDAKRFAMLTALTAGKLHFGQNESLNLSPGATAFLPADGWRLALDGEEFLLSLPAMR